jgi:hypothetical protein
LVIGEIDVTVEKMEAIVAERKEIEMDWQKVQYMAE